MCREKKEVKKTYIYNLTLPESEEYVCSLLYCQHLYIVGTHISPEKDKWNEAS